MPTGYTADIKKGITFQQFALNCAKAFGACISMRDDPTGTPIPDEFKPDTYHSDQLHETLAEIARIEAMADYECAAESCREYLSESARYTNLIRDKLELRQKYEAMLEQVRAWNPPSGDHSGLKDFMVQQITDSVEFDCGTEYYTEAKEKLRQKSGSEWRWLKLGELRRDATRHEEEQRKENERVAGRNEWVRKLRESLEAQ